MPNRDICALIDSKMKIPYCKPETALLTWTAFVSLCTSPTSEGYGDAGVYPGMETWEERGGTWL